MQEILNIDDSAYQKHFLIFEESEIILELRYLSPVQQWFISAEYKNRSIKNAKLSCGSIHMRAKNFPFDFFVVDNYGYDVDPFRLTDFSDGRCTLYLLDASEMQTIRGTSVEI